MQALIIKIKCFTLHIMNLRYMKVSLFEISYKKRFHHILFFLDVPVALNNALI